MTTEVTLRECGLTRKQAAAAVLPIKYKQMVAALKACERADECLTMMDQAAAIAAYYRQAVDREPVYIAQRIRDRAVRRLGELLALRSKTTGYTLGSARKEAGVREGMGVAAVAVARLSEDKFESLVESTPPASIEALVQAGRTSKRYPGREISIRNRRISLFENAVETILGAYAPRSVAISPLSRLEAVRALNALRKAEEHFDRLAPLFEKAAK
jgi:hypothetical protein